MTTTTDAAHTSHMKAALGLARRALGRVWPNPAVGCVIVDKDGNVAGRGWTQPGGRPHAETEALKRCGDKSLGATAYITLEPCAHHGQTPPCADALVEAGIKCAVIATGDPDQRVSGEGMARLEKAGIKVITGICEDHALDLNAGYFLKNAEGRPLFTLKVATSLDGRIATGTGDSQWITGAVARAMGHGLRASHDAVLTGIGTALADRPRLTCRLPGMESSSPVRVVVDSHLRLPLDSPMVETAGKMERKSERKTERKSTGRTDTWVFTIGNAPGNKQWAGKRRALEERGVTVIEAEGDPRPDLNWVAAELARRGLTRVLVEGGGTLTGSLLAAGLVDRVAWFRAPRVIGADGIPAADIFGAASLDRVPGFVRQKIIAAGPDTLEMYRRQG